MENPERGQHVKLLELLLRQGCTHRFSWPRIDNCGRHYQVCLACGAAYEYDWQVMRRTNRLLARVVQNELHGGGVSH
jgi:hypothetical protein